MADTIFTKIINKEIPAEILYEDEKHIAFLDLTPFEKGHTLVIPKKSYETIFEMPEEEYLELSRVVHRVANHLSEKLNSGINIWLNNKEVAGQEIPHLHFHVIPRKEKKKTYALENREKYLEGEISNYGEYLKLK